MTKPSDFRISFAGADFMWGPERYPGMPILRWPDGAICEPVVSYFGHSAETRRIALSSMKVEAYCIREWLAHLSNEGRTWDSADDALLQGWRESQRGAVEEGSVSKRRVERKLAAVFAFYRHVVEVLPLDERGRRRAPFVGDVKSGCAITSREVRVRRGGVREVWNLAGRVAPSFTAPSSPDDATLAALLRSVRSRPDRRTSRRKASGAQAMLVLLADRDWMICRCMAEAGLRAAEVAGLTLDALAVALEKRKIVRSGRHGGEGGHRHPLDVGGESRTTDAKMLAALDARTSGKGKEDIYVEVVGKGNKKRDVPFPADLVRDLLVVAIWDVRRVWMEGLGKDRGGTALPPFVFLSSKQVGGLRPGSVSDLVKDAFVALGLSGSAHRLRAYFATNMAFRIWDEVFRGSGFRDDQTVVNLALERLRSALGHDSVDTTVRHYLDLALQRHLSESGARRRELLQGVWDIISRYDNELTKRKLALVTATIERLASCSEDSMFSLVLTDALAQIPR